MVDLRELIQKVLQAKDKLELQNLKTQFLDSAVLTCLWLAILFELILVNLPLVSFYSNFVKEKTSLFY